MWIGRVGKFVGCGISGGTIALLDEEQRSVVKTWSTKKWAFSFTSIPHKSIILSGWYYVKDYFALWCSQDELIMKLCIRLQGSSSFFC